MTPQEQAKRTNLMKLEAMSLFSSIRAFSGTSRWWYFAEMQKLGRTIRLEQSISPYRASLHWDYIFCGIECQIYLEREAHVGNVGDDLWCLSFSGIEGKVHSLTIQEHLKALSSEGFYIPNGNENLERQMNFSLGLYGDCMMHVDVHFPLHQPPLACALQILDLIDRENQASTPSLDALLQELDTKKTANPDTDDSDSIDLIMGDWQTWK